MINQLQEEIDEMQQCEPSTENIHREKILQNQLDEEPIRKYLFWRQKSREIWVKEGDRNTRLFHLSTIIHKRRNYVAAIKNQNNKREQDYKKIGNYFLDNFKELYTSKQYQFPPDLEDLFQPILSSEENVELI